MSQDLLVTEIFHSLQGESSLVGIPFAFIRLTGCNLRCSYCDSSYAFKGGQVMSVNEILSKVQSFQVRHVLLTGGEPLLQRQTPRLAAALVGARYQLSLETHGEVSIEPVTQLARIIMDIKTPSSGMCRGDFKSNFPFLKKSDEIKLVIASSDDYFWARDLLPSLPDCEILFSPAVWAPAMPGSFPGITPQWLAEKILEDRLPVRFQLQLHKQIWGATRRGV